MPTPRRASRRRVVVGATRRSGVRPAPMTNLTFSMADVIDLLSNQVGVALTPDGIRRLAAYNGDLVHIEEPQAFKIHGLEARLGSETVGDVVSRYESGESATSIAKDLSVA